MVLNLIISAVEALSGATRYPRVSMARSVSNSMVVGLRESGPGLDPNSPERLQFTLPIESDVVYPTVHMGAKKRLGKHPLVIGAWAH